MTFFMLTQEVWYRIYLDVTILTSDICPLYYNTEYWLSKHKWPFHFQQCQQNTFPTTEHIGNPAASRP